MVSSMNTKKIIGAVAIAGGLAGGGVVGALLGAPAVSSAQSSTSSDSSSSSSTPAPPGAPGMPGMPGEGHGPHGGFHPGGINLETAANALGMTVDELRTELEGGKTIAQVASDKGVDVQTVIDALVADAKTKITNAVNNGLPKPPDGPGPKGFGIEGRGPGLDAAATALNMTADELRTELEGGKTIAQVAGEKSVDVQTVIDAMVADASARLDQAVADGKLTSDEAAQRKADLANHIADFVNNGHPKGPGPGRPHR
jgi:hypothetical protein